MTKLEAIAQCRAVFEAEVYTWSAPLILCLGEGPAGEARVFAWLTSCVAELLVHFGVSNERLVESLQLARRISREGQELAPIEARAWELWQEAHANGQPTRAVAQLLFALIGYRHRKKFSPVGCTAPIGLLNGLATRHDEVLERVLSHFASHAEVVNLESDPQLVDPPPEVDHGPGDGLQIRGIVEPPADSGGVR